MSNTLLRVLRRIALSEPSPRIIESLEKLAIRMNIDEKEVMRIYIEMKNKMHVEQFKNSSFSDRILLLPQCLRNKECPAKLTEYGYICQECGKCRIPEIIRLAKSLGYKVFIVPGGSMVEKILRTFKPKAVLGVACEKELVLGSIACEKAGIPGQGICLLRDGCVETDVDWRKVKEMILLRRDSLSEESLITSGKKLEK